MHEMSIAAGLMDRLLGFTTENPDKQIVTVRMCIGELTHIDAEQLRFCYGAITTATDLAGSTLDIKATEASVQCPHCSYVGRPKYWDDALAGVSVVTLQCPDCGRSAEAIQGHECAIKSVQYREEVIT